MLLAILLTEIRQGFENEENKGVGMQPDAV
jgi:hypothetical protein